MRLNSKWLAVLLVLTVIPLAGCNFVNKLRARDNLNKGVKTFTEMSTMRLLNTLKRRSNWIRISKLRACISQQPIRLNSFPAHPIPKAN